MFPVLVRVGHVALPTFGVVAAIGLMGGLLLSQRTARLAGVDADGLWDAGLFGVMAAFVSSRVLLVVEHLQSFLRFPLLLLAVPSLTASGVLLTLLATGVWLWRKQVPWRRALDAWAPCGALVWGFLALGHWAEGSDPGLGGRPVALYAAVLAWVVAGGGYAWLRRTGRAAWFVLVAAGVGQFFLCFWRVPGVAMPGGLEALEWVGLGMVGAGAVLLLEQSARVTR